MRDASPTIISGVAVDDGIATVYGQPGVYPWLPPEEQHNCDAMGCGQLHVLARVRVDESGTGAPECPRADIVKHARRWASEAANLCNRGHEHLVIAALIQVLRIVLEETGQPPELRQKVIEAIATPGTKVEDVVLFSTRQ